MIPMPLIAYDAAGNIVGVLDYWVRYDETKPDRPPLGLVDFAAMEEAGMPFDGAVWNVDTAVGSKVWPEFLGNRFGDFTVELTGPAGRKRIAALVHKGSGHRRERAEIEAAIEGRIRASRDAARRAGIEARRGLSRKAAKAVPDPEPEPTDIRDLVGGPGRPLGLDKDGRTLGRGRPEAPPPLLGG